MSRKGTLAVLSCCRRTRKEMKLYLNILGRAYRLKMLCLMRRDAKVCGGQMQKVERTKAMWIG